MILHANAALSRRQRERLVMLVSAGTTITAAAMRVGCSRQTASKWIGRSRRGEGLSDRSSRPHRSPRSTAAAVERAVLHARRELREGPHMLGWRLGLAPSTVHAILRRHGHSRLSTPTNAEPIVRYERERAGELVHVDVKKLGRIVVPGHRVTGNRSQPGRGQGRLAVPLRRDRRRQPTRLRSPLPRRDRRLSARLPRRARPLLPPARRQRRTRADRQRQMLQATLGRSVRR